VRGIVLVPDNTRLPFMRLHRLFFVFSAALVAASIALLVGRGLNFGIDFVGGVAVEVRTPDAADVAAIRSALGGLGIGDVSVQEFGTPRDVLIRVGRQPGGDEAQQRTLETVRQALGSTVEFRRAEVVGPQVSAELLQDGIYATVAALAAILVYVWFRFEWQFGFSGLVALMHDIVSTLGLFSLLGLEFNLATVAAVLTIAGYSINDTVVIFDRVRENLRRYKTMPLTELLDLSNNQTLSRTFNTGLTTLLALLSLYFLGGEVISGFCLALIWGIIIGTYSSVCLATPLLLYLGIRRAPAAEGVPEAGAGNS
jgi:preprotein translocase subunit SecF